jgi:hypothetical protein
MGCAYGIGNSENAHIKSGGKGRKADARFIIPLCHECHEELHFMGARTFSMTVGINLEKAAAVTEAAWLSYQSGAVSVIQGDQ